MNERVKNAVPALLKAAGYFCVYLMPQFFLVYVILLFFGLFPDAGEAGIPTNEKITLWVQNNGVLLTVLANTAAVFLLLVVTLLRKRNFFAECGARRATPSLVGLSCLLGVFSALGVELIFQLPFPESWMESYIESSSGVAGTPLPILALGVLVSAPITEELVFRGFCYSTLRRAFPAWASALVMSVLFGIVHGTIVWFLYTFLLGMLMCLILERVGSLYATVALHFGFNLVGFLEAVFEERYASLSAPAYYSMMAVGILGAALLTLLILKKTERKPLS